MQFRGYPTLSVACPLLLILVILPDKVSPQKSASVEGHTHLAHSVVRYLGLTAPPDLEEYGIMSAGDIVNMISRVMIEPVCRSFPTHSICALVCHEHVGFNLTLAHPYRCRFVTACRTHKSLVPPKRSGCFPSRW